MISIVIKVQSNKANTMHIEAVLKTFYLKTTLIYCLLVHFYLMLHQHHAIRVSNFVPKKVNFIYSSFFFIFNLLIY